MIIYKNVLGRLKNAGYTTYTLLKEKLISQRTLTAIRHNEPVNTKTIDTICRLAKCQPGDIMEYVAESNTKKNVEV